MGSILDQIFNYIDKAEFDSAIQLVKEQLSKRDQNFIEDFILSLNIISDSALSVVQAIMPSMMGILNFEDDVVRYSLIVSLKKFIEAHPSLIFPFIEDYLQYGSAKSREGMLLLLKYIADIQPKSLAPYYHLIIPRLADSEDFVKKKAVEILQTLGKADHSEIESKILLFVKNQEEKRDSDLKKISESEEEKNILDAKSYKVSRTHDDFKKAADEVLKVLAEVALIEKDEISRRQLEAQSKALEDKLKEEEEKLKIEKLKLEEEQKQIEQKKLQQEKDQLEKKKELLEKQLELEQVKQELELKRIEEEKAKIIAEEAERIQKKLKELDQQGDDDEYEELV